jgi:hypothetical protein
MTDYTFIAREVAEDIFQYSYRSYEKGIQVHDLLLFDSTTIRKRHKKQRPHAQINLGLLVIHNLPALLRLGHSTDYDSRRVLTAMGTPTIEDEREEEVLTWDRYHNYLDLVAREDGEDFVEMARTPLNDPRRIMNYEHTLSAEYQVGITLSRQGLDFKSLDLLVMHRRLLTPEGVEERRKVLSNPQDHAFWYDILTKGQLYHSGLRGFHSFELGYRGITELFRPAQTHLPDSP